MAKARENNRQNPPRRRRRRRRMSLGAGIALIIIALLVGALGGYLAGHGAQNGTLVERETQLANANSRIADLESALTMMGVDPNQEVFEDLTPLVEGATVGDLVGELTPVANNNALVEGGDMLAQSEDAQQEPQVVAEFDGVQVMSDEVLDVYNASVNSLLLNGQDVSEFADSLLEQALNTVVTDKIRYLKAEELGLTTLTAEDEAAIDAQAQAQYESYLEFYMFEGIDDETALAEAEERLAADGNSLEDLREQYAQDWWEQKLQDYVTADLTVTDEALEETYALYLEQQRDLYDADPAQYELARRYGGQTVTYNPEGYRTIKLIFLPFDTETSMRVSEINGKLFELAGGEDPDQIDQLEGELETYYAQLETTAEEILDRIAQGESFDSLIEEFSQDADRDLPSVREEGYYVSSSTQTLDATVVEAAMALESVGDVTDAPVRADQGVYLLMYASDVTPGAIPLEQLRDALSDEALETLKYETYSQQLAAWVEEANVVYHREALQ